MNEAISFEELGIIPCRADTKNKMRRPIFAKIRYEFIPIFYEKMGYIFRNANNTKQYYSMEELQELFKNYVGKSINLYGDHVTTIRQN